MRCNMWLAQSGAVMLRGVSFGSRQKAFTEIKNSTEGMISSSTLRRQKMRVLTAMKFVCLAAAVFICIGSVTAKGQNATGTIIGFVTDSSGSVIVKASITATDVLTNQSQTKQTDATGRYEFVDLPVGKYDVQAEQTGFKKTVHSGIVVDADSNNRVDFALAVGSENQQVTVSAQAVQVNTETAEVGETITSKEIADLPLNGRDAGTLITLTPGTNSYQMVNWWGFNTTFVVSGGAYFQNRATDWLLDGGLFTWTYVQSGAQLPNPDALEEFHYAVNERNAEFGREGNATVNAVIKSGTNQFHGDAWEFNRNAGVNARPYLSSAVNPKLVQNQFGFTIGGPVIRNRAFFFGSYEGFRQSGAGFVFAVPVPTTQERQGNFSDAVANITGGQLTNPVTGVSYAGNVIPVNPVSAKILAWLPAANTQSSSGIMNEWTGNAPNISTTDQYLVKLDYNLTSKQKFEGSYYHLGGSGTNEQGSNIVATPASITNYLAQQFEYQWNVSHIWSISATKINTARFVYFGIGSPRGWLQAANQSLQDLGATFTSGIDPHPPAVCVSGYFSLDCTNDGNDWTHSQQYIDTFRWALGRHQISLGGSYLHDHHYYFFSPGPWIWFNGGIQYGAGVPGNSTGNALADFVLGDASEFQYGYPDNISGDNSQNLYGGFVQDNWHLNRRLSLNLGVRWEYLAPIYNISHDSVVFRPGVQSTLFPDYLPGWLFKNQFTGRHDAEWTDAGGITMPQRFDPRFGFSYDIFGNGKTALRGGAGIYSSQTGAINITPGDGPYSVPSPSCWPGTVNQVSISNPYGAPTGAYSGPATCDIIQAAKGWNGPPANYSAPVPFNGGGLVPSTSRPYTIDFSLGIEEQLTPSTFLDVTYAGNVARKQWRNFDYFGGATYVPGATVGNVPARYPYLNNGALAACQANPTSTACTTLLASPGNVASVIALGTPDNGAYNALLAQLNHRMSHGLLVTSSYTWSHAQDANQWPAQNWALGFHGRYGTSNSNFTHNLVVSFVYGPELHVSDRLTRTLLNGWELTGIAQFESGAPFNVWTGRDDIFNSNNGSTETLVNKTGNLKLASHRSRQAEMAEWFNTSLVSDPGIGHIGNSGWNSVKSPRLKNLNASLLRDFNIYEQLKFQFHFDTFNTFNWVNLGGPDSTMNTPNFGKITGAGAMRQLQFGGKIIF